MWYNENAFSTQEDRATLGSDPSACVSFRKGGYPRGMSTVALWKTKAINPFNNFKEPRSPFHIISYGSIS